MSRSERKAYHVVWLQVASFPDNFQTMNNYISITAALDHILRTTVNDKFNSCKTDTL